MRAIVVLAVCALASKLEAQSETADAVATSSAGVQVVLRRSAQLAGAIVDVYSIAGERAGGAAADEQEKELALVPGTYELRAAYAIGASSVVRVPLQIHVSPEAARTPEGAVLISKDAHGPIVVDVSLAASGTLSEAELVAIAPRYAGACTTPNSGLNAFAAARQRALEQAGERCANLAYIQQTWTMDGKAAAAEEASRQRAVQDSLKAACEMHSARACAAWDGVAQADLERLCTANKEGSWAACVRYHAPSTPPPLYYDARYEPVRPVAKLDERPRSNEGTHRVLLGVAVWRSPERENPYDIPVLARVLLKPDETTLHVLGLTTSVGLAVQHLPVLRAGTSDVADHYQLVGFHFEAGYSLWAGSLLRVDGTGFYQAFFNQSASTLGLKAELVLIVGDFELSGVAGFARFANLTRGADGAASTSIGGADHPFFGGAIFGRIGGD